jgi:hypothetical protein
MYARRPANNPRTARNAALAATLALALAVAQAHDTWFAVVPSAPGAPPLLALGTGNRFPVQEFPLGMEQLRHSGCHGVDGTVLPLKFERDGDTALVLRAPLPAAEGLNCWVQTVPFELELEDDKIALYLKEIQAPADVRGAWAALRARPAVARALHQTCAHLDGYAAGGIGQRTGRDDGHGRRIAKHRLAAARG